MARVTEKGKKPVAYWLRATSSATAMKRAELEYIKINRGGKDLRRREPPVWVACKVWRSTETEKSKLKGVIIL